MPRLLLLISFFAASFQMNAFNFQPKTAASEKSLHVVLDETGIISVGRDTVSSENLARYLQDRLFKKFMGTGRMYKRITFSKANNKVPQVVADVVLKQIKLGQEKALTQLCLQKYNVYYEDISARQKAKLKKNFPVLFQTKFNKATISEKK